MSPECGQSFSSLSHPGRVSTWGGGAGGSSTGARPQVSMDVAGGPLCPAWRWTPTQLPEQGRARLQRPGQTLGLLCPTSHAAQPRNPSPPPPQAGRKVCSALLGEERIQAGAGSPARTLAPLPSGWASWASLSLLEAWFLHLQDEHGEPDSVWVGLREEGGKESTGLRGHSKGTGQGPGHLSAGCKHG